MNLPSTDGPLAKTVREFWLQILICCWWALTARVLINFLALPMAIRKTAIEYKLLSDIIAATIYVCSALAMMGFVFGLSLHSAGTRR
jgi:hypothetical protein